MIVWTAVPLVLSLVAVLTVGPANSGLTGRRQTWSIALAAIALAAASTVGLTITAWYGIARLPWIAAVGGWTPGELGQESPVPPIVSWISLATLTLVAARTAQRGLRGFRALRQAHGCLPPTHTAELIRLPTLDVEAFAVARFGRRPGRIVITDGLLAELPDETMRHAVISHESAHLRHHHFAFRFAVRFASAANPLLGPLEERLELATERWADEEAAARVGPTATAAAIATVALARNRRPIRAVLYAAHSHVVTRVDALLHPTPLRQGRGVTTWTAGLSILAALAILIATRRTEGFFEHLAR